MQTVTALMRKYLEQQAARATNPEDKRRFEEELAKMGIKR